MLKQMLNESISGEVLKPSPAFGGQNNKKNVSQGQAASLLGDLIIFVPKMGQGLTTLW